MLIVFDLDFTLWNAGGTWCDQTRPPYRKAGNNIEDADGSELFLYPDVIEILEFIEQKKIPMAVASRTYSPEIARKLMDMFEIRRFFDFEEIYPDSKIQHFKSLQKRTGVPYSTMYFFDDEHRNIEEVGTLGVQTFLVSSGMKWNELKGVPGLSKSP